MARGRPGKPSAPGSRLCLIGMPGSVVLLDDNVLQSAGKPPRHPYFLARPFGYFAPELGRVSNVTQAGRISPEKAIVIRSNISCGNDFRRIFQQRSDHVPKDGSLRFYELRERRHNPSRSP